MDFKRPIAGMTGMSMVPVPFKRTKNDLLVHDDTHFRATKQIQSTAATGYVQKTNLMAPTVLLSGHEGEVYCVKFLPPKGDLIVSAGFDRKLFVWKTYGECENLAAIPGHGGAILDLQSSTDGDIVYTASTDKTIGVWDIESLQRIKRVKGHSNIVNACNTNRRGQRMLCSGSDDGTIKLWDHRLKKEAHSFNNTYQVLAVTFNDTADTIFSGGIDNVIKAWDIRKMDISMRLSGHTDTVTGLSLSPDGSYLLSNAMDNTLKVWDVRPYAAAERCTHSFQGHQHTFEKNILKCNWSADGKKVTCGSGDRFVHVWDTVSRRLLYKLPGHTASVNETGFHPLEPILISAGNDKKIFMGEIQMY